MAVIRSIRDDAERLRTILVWLRQLAVVKDVGIIAHSRGCIDVALAAIHPLKSVMLLAPPLQSGHVREYYTGRAGSLLRGGEWFVPRSDGTTSIISESMFDEYEQLDLVQIISDYAALQPLHIIAAGADQILVDQDFSQVQYAPGVTLVTVQSASHDFSDSSRNELVELINS